MINGDATTHRSQPLPSHHHGFPLGCSKVCAMSTLGAPAGREIGTAGGAFSSSASRAVAAASSAMGGMPCITLSIEVELHWDDKAPSPKTTGLEVGDGSLRSSSAR